MKLLILTSRFPYPLEKGDKLRAYYQIRELSQHYDIILFSLSDKKVAPQALEALQPYCYQIHLHRLHTPSISWHLFTALFSSLPFQVAYFFRKRILKRLEQVIEEESPELVFCQLIRMARYCYTLSIPATLDYMDAFSLGLRRRASKERGAKKWLIQWEGRRVEQFEKEVQGYFAYQSIISESDRQNLNLPQPEQVLVLPNGIDTNFFYPPSPSSPTYDCVFIGNLGYFPNREACEFLVHEIMPLLDKSVRLLIAGADADRHIKSLGNLPGVTVQGWVPDIRTAYSQGKLFVAPLFSGSGQQNKILEAMAMALPVLTTPLVNQAIGAQEGREILLANTAQDFAHQITQILTHPLEGNQLGGKGRSFVQKTYSWEKSGEMLHRHLERAISS